MYYVGPDDVKNPKTVGWSDYLQVCAEGQVSIFAFRRLSEKTRLERASPDGDEYRRCDRIGDPAEVISA